MSLSVVLYITFVWLVTLIYTEKPKTLQQNLKKDDSYDFFQTQRSPETYKSKFFYKRGDVTTVPDLSVASLLPLASTDDIAKLGWEFLADAFLAFTYGGCGGVTEVGKDGIGVAEEYTQCADEFLVVEVTIVE